MQTGRPYGHLAVVNKHLMLVILLLVLLSLLVAGGFLIAFLWAAGTGQYEDEVTPAIRILFDSETTDDDTDR